MLEKGADVHLPNKAGGTALMLAAGTGEITLVRALLRAGADVNAQVRMCMISTSGNVILLTGLELILISDSHLSPLDQTYN